MKQFNVPIIYKSPLISGIKNKRKEADKLKKDTSPTALMLGKLNIYLSRHFGFCYGVENAIDIAFKTIEENPEKRIFLLSEMIHNPQVNQDLVEKGVRFLQDTKGNSLIDLEEISQEDIVLIPAFGTTLEIEKKLRDKGIAIENYNTTCPFVEKVWNRSAQISAKGYSIVVHGKPTHEETRATFSHTSALTPTVIVNDMQEAIELGKYIKGEKDIALFYEEFSNRYSLGFDVSKDLERIGVVNQTTQLASETQAIAEYLKGVMQEKYHLNDATIPERFAETRDTLCYATNDNQSAVISMLNTPADLAIVIGGFNSSNTSHLVEICEEKLPTYFIESEKNMISSQEILHCNWRTKEIRTIIDWLPTNKTITKVLITSGASCPDALVEGVIRKLAEYFSELPKLEEVIQDFA